MKLFKCDFGKGVCCSVQIPDDPPKGGENYQPIVKWHGRPTNKTLRSYIRWMNSVNRQVAKEWGIGFVHAYVTSSKGYEIYRYTAEGQSVLEEKYHE